MTAEAARGQQATGHHPSSCEDLVRDVLGEQLPERPGEEFEPAAEVLGPHTVEPGMHRPRVARVAGLVKEGRAPEVDHLVEMLGPVAAHAGLEDRAQELVLLYPSVERVHQPRDPGAVEFIGHGIYKYS